MQKILYIKNYKNKLLSKERNKMRVLFIILAFNFSLFAFEGQLVKAVTKFFSKESATIISKEYGEKGVEALAVLQKKYGKNALIRFNTIKKLYGKKGINYLIKYGEIAVKNPTVFNLVNKHGAKGVYLIKQFPLRAPDYYKKYGDKFFNISNKYGDKRVIRYLDGAKKFQQDDKIIHFLDKYGDKGNSFLNNHWGKLLTSGFVLLNANSLIQSTENIGNEVVDKTAKAGEESVKNIVNSQLGIFIGIALLLFVFFKYGYEKIFSSREK